MPEPVKTNLAGLNKATIEKISLHRQEVEAATVNREAHTLMANPKITTRVERLQRQKDRAMIAASLSDRERVLTKLRDLIDNAQGTTAEATMLRACDLLGKSVGLYKDVIEIPVQKSAAELIENLEQMLSEMLDSLDEAGTESAPDESLDSAIH